MDNSGKDGKDCSKDDGATPKTLVATSTAYVVECRLVAAVVKTLKR